jgi:ABC-type sugar transport system ATPase subunit
MRSPTICQDRLGTTIIMENVNQSERACCCFALAGVRPNECLGLLGPNGAGKTTTFRMMTAAEAPSSGEVHVSGFSASTEAQKVWRSLGFCPQHDALWPELSTRQHLKLYAELKGANTKQTSLSRGFRCKPIVCRDRLGTNTQGKLKTSRRRVCRQVRPGSGSEQHAGEVGPGRAREQEDRRVERRESAQAFGPRKPIPVFRKPINLLVT